MTLLTTVVTKEQGLILSTGIVVSCSSVSGFVNHECQLERDSLPDRNISTGIFYAHLLIHTCRYDYRQMILNSRLVFKSATTQ